MTLKVFTNREDLQGDFPTAAELEPTQTFSPAQTNEIQPFKVTRSKFATTRCLTLFFECLPFEVTESALSCNFVIRFPFGNKCHQIVRTPRTPGCSKTALARRMGLSNPIVHTRKGKASASATTSICTPSHIATGRLSSSANTAHDSTAVGSQNVPVIFC